MALTPTAPFPQKPRSNSVVAGTAASTFSDDNPTNTVLLGTMGLDGAVLTKLSALPRASNSACTLFLWAQRKNETTKRLVATAYAQAFSVSGSSSNWLPVSFGFTELNTLRLEAEESLYVGAGVAVAQGWVFRGEWTDY